MEPKDILDALSAPFEAADIKWKPQAVKNGRALAVAYLDARAIQDRLDEVFGVGGWQDEYQLVADGSVVCKLSVRIGDDWVSKMDVGSPSEQPDGGDRLKAAFSDALKRAAVKLGVGRYLYRLGGVWADYDPVRKQFTNPPTLPRHALPGPVTHTQPPRQALPAKMPDDPRLLPDAPDPTPNPILRQTFAERYKHAASPAEVSNVDKAVAEKVRELAEVDKGFLRQARADALARFAKVPA